MKKSKYPTKYRTLKILAALFVLFALMQALTPR